MNPLLRQPRHISVALLIWSPFAIGLAAIISLVANSAPLRTALLVFPPMLLELFIVLSTWYLCAFQPLEPRRIFQIVFFHAITALVLTGAWLLLTLGYVELLGVFYPSPVWHDMLYEVWPIFLAAGVLFYFLAVLFNYLFMALEKSEQAQRQILEQRFLASQAELNMLKMTIHPHFIFNSFTTLGALSRKAPEKAEKMCSQLSEFMRYSLRHGDEEFVTVKEELNHVRNYLAVEKIRLGSRLKINYAVDKNTFSGKIPPLTLLPLVENGVKHGISQCVNGGILNISIKRERKSVSIEISNPFELPSKTLKGEGMGLDTLKRRLKTIYSGKASVYCSRKDNSFTVRVLIPLKVSSGND